MARIEARPKRGEIYLMNFDPALGSEIKGPRPALILQNNVGNEFAETTIVAAITSHKISTTVFPTSIHMPKGEGGLDVDSILLLGQIRTIDKIRLTKRLGSLSAARMSQVNKAAVISLGIISVE